jgi:predicted Fe-Mo cluster-binding NifX family protein
MPKIAVASQNFRTVTGHAGKTRRFLVYRVEPGDEPEEIDRLDLPKEMSFHELHDASPHPLDGVQVLIVGSCGEGFVRRLARRGIEVVATAETDPLRAIRDYLAGTLKPPQPQVQGPHPGDLGES